MRTTVRLDDALLRAAKEAAARDGRTLTAVIEDALRQALARSEAVRSTEPYRVATFRSGLGPGVDLDSNADLLDLMGSA